MNGTPDDSFRRRYPDLVEAGGLYARLDQALAGSGSALRCERIEQLPFAYANVSNGDRHSQVMLVAEHRAFSVDFWCRGVQYGSGWAGDLDEAVRAIVAFNEKAASATRMGEEFDWYREAGGVEHERGAESFVDRAWSQLLAYLEREPPESAMGALRPLAEEASKRPALRQLLPFTSHASLCFSRTTGYPYTDDCPICVPEASGRYRVSRPGRGEWFGDLDPGEAADTLVDMLPPGCGPAVDGTADD